MIITGVQDQSDINWLKERSGYLLCEDTEAFVCRHEGEIWAMAAMDHWTNIGCNLHLAVDNPRAFKYGLAEAVCDHVFNKRGKKKIFGLVPSDNDKAIRLNTHMGADIVGMIDNYFGDGLHYVVMEATREKCARWLPKEQEAA